MMMRRIRLSHHTVAIAGWGATLAVVATGFSSSSANDSSAESTVTSDSRGASADNFIPTSRFPIAPSSSIRNEIDNKNNSGSSSSSSYDDHEHSSDLSSSISLSKRVYNFFPAVYRIINLGTTAGAIVYEYKTSDIKKNSANEESIDRLHRKLQELQDELDTQVVRRYDAKNSDKEVEFWIEKAKQTRMEIEANTELIGIHEVYLWKNLL